MQSPSGVQFLLCMFLALSLPLCVLQKKSQGNGGTPFSPSMPGGSGPAGKTGAQQSGAPKSGGQQSGGQQSGAQKPAGPTGAVAGGSPSNANAPQSAGKKKDCTNSDLTTIFDGVTSVNARPIPLPNTAINPTNAHGIEILHGCQPDYELVDSGNDKVLCNNGIWEAPKGKKLPECALKSKCTKAKLEENLAQGITISGQLADETADGDTAKLKCEGARKHLMVPGQGNKDDVTVTCNLGVWNFGSSGQIEDLSCKFKPCTKAKLEAVFSDDVKRTIDFSSIGEKTDHGTEGKVQCIGDMIFRTGGKEGDIPCKDDGWVVSDNIKAGCVAVCKTDTLNGAGILSLKFDPEFTDTVFAGELKTVSCEKGYQLEDATHNQMKCDAAGKWQPVDAAKKPKCLPQCKDDDLMKDFPDSKFTRTPPGQAGEFGEHGSKVNVECVKGYRYTNEKTMQKEMVCGIDGKWKPKTGPRPTCEQKGCPAPTATGVILKKKDGSGNVVKATEDTKHPGEYAPGTNYEVHCETGRELTNQNARAVECKKGQWAPAIPSCDLKTCPLLQIEHVEDPDSTKDAVHDEKKTVTCEVGYQIRAQKVVPGTHNPSGPGNPGNNPVTPSQPTPTPTARIQPGSLGDSKRKIELGCNDGKWSHKDVTCVEVSCQIWPDFDAAREDLVLTSNGSEPLSDDMTEKGRYPAGIYELTCKAPENYAIRSSHVVECAKTNGAFEFQVVNTDVKGSKNAIMPKCELYCKNLDLEHANVAPDNIAGHKGDQHSKYFVGDKVKVTCHQGYKNVNDPHPIDHSECKKTQGTDEAKLDPEADLLDCSEYGCVNPGLSDTIKITQPQDLNRRFDINEEIQGECPAKHHWTLGPKFTVKCIEEVVEPKDYSKLPWASMLPGLSPECEPDLCKKFQVPNGKLTIKVKGSPSDDENNEMLSSGTKVEVTCDADYQLVPKDSPNLIECEETHWKGAIPGCVSTKCASYSLENGVFENADGDPKAEDWYLTGTTLIAKCSNDHTHKIYGNEKIVCENGAWTSPTNEFPSCVAKKCPAPQVPNANYFGGQSYYNDGATVDIMCNPNYKPFPRTLTQPFTFTCKPDGSWDKGTFQYCRSTSCPSFKVPNGKIVTVLQPGEAMFRADTVVEVECNPGYILEPGVGSVASCNGDTQEWGPIPACTKVPPLPQVPHGEAKGGALEGQKELYDSKASPKLVCEDGFEQKGSLSFKFDPKTKSWGPESGTEPPHCEDIADVVVPTLFILLLLVFFIVIGWYAYARCQDPDKIWYLHRSFPGRLAPKDDDQPDFVKSKKSSPMESEAGTASMAQNNSGPGEGGVSTQRKDVEVDPASTLEHVESEVGGAPPPSDSNKSVKLSTSLSGKKR